MRDTLDIAREDEHSAAPYRGTPAAAAHSRLFAAGTHLGVSFLIGVAAFLVVRFVWYPNAFWEMSGGRNLFFLVLSVDIVIGPLIKLTIFNPRKSRRALALDLAIIGTLQLAALSYGLWTIAMARPLFAIFNVDRITVVTASDLAPGDMVAAERPELKSFPWFSPELIAVRHAMNPAERNERLESAMAGRDVPQLPKYYVPYQETSAEVLRHLQPLGSLPNKNPLKRNVVQSEISHLGAESDSFAYLPTVARGDWVAIVDKRNGVVREYLPLNGF